MKARQITPSVDWVGAVDWERGLFDALIPLPDRTSYNAYLVRGSEKTALIDTVDPAMLERADDARWIRRGTRSTTSSRTHAEQDHSGGLIPRCWSAIPQAQLLATPEGQGACSSDAPGHRRRSSIQPVEDGETLSLGDKTLQLHPHPLGALARDDGSPGSRRTHPLHVPTSSARTWRLRDLFASPTRAAVLRGRQALLRRDHDALPRA